MRHVNRRLGFAALVALSVLFMVKRDIFWTTPYCIQTSNNAYVAVPEGRSSGNLIRQRNSLSQLMNGVKQDLMRQDCEMLKLKHKLGQDKGQMASLSGGWCLPYAQKSAHVCDEPLARAISELLKGKAVAGFGDGPGMYKEIHDRRGLMASYHAYDGSPYIENVTNNMVKFMDLTIPQYGLPLYDWVVCLEVAEHIPHKYQDVFLDNIARHARSGIIMSWAPPGQGGLNHINEQSREEVQRIMKNIDFALDLNSTKVLRDASSVNWLKRNVKVYRRISGVDPDENEA